MSDITTCPDCQGTGLSLDPEWLDDPPVHVCATCRGSGRTGEIPDAHRLRLEPWQQRFVEAFRDGGQVELVPTRRGYRWAVIDDPNA